MCPGSACVLQYTTAITLVSARHEVLHVVPWGRLVDVVRYELSRLVKVIVPGVVLRAATEVNQLRLVNLVHWPVLAQKHWQIGFEFELVCQ